MCGWLEAGEWVNRVWKVRAFGRSAYVYSYLSRFLGLVGNTPCMNASRVRVAAVGTGDPCSSSPCLNNGVCFSTGTTTFSCACVGGYTGSTCQSEYLSVLCAVTGAPVRVSTCLCCAR